MPAFTIEKRPHEAYGEIDVNVYTCPRCGFSVQHDTFERVSFIAGRHAETCKIIECDCGKSHNPWVMGCMEANRL